MKQPARCLLNVVLLLPALAVAGDVGGQTARAERLQGAIHLDGSLDEPAWETAGLIPDLVQQSPHPGEATPYRTEVRFLEDAENLFIGVRAFDPEPGQIAVHTMRRDGDMEGDDTLSFVIDTFGDGRTGYLFRINAAGARQDGLIGGASDYSVDWDGIWDAHTRRQPDGWSAEIEIPAQTLRFKKRQTSWGFNVERYIARDRVTLRWACISLDVAFNDLSQAGRLEGVEQMKQGLGLSLSPYGLSRWIGQYDVDNSTLQGAAGLDVTYRFTPQLSSVLTANTDFAETEVDALQINLTRFELVFPEKRPFFLEGANQFGFATGLDTDFIPFYSRRVGLSQTAAGDLFKVPIDAGLKILGRAGPWGIGVLDALTGEVDSVKSTNLFAGRVTFDAGPHLRLGSILTHGDPDASRSSTLGGVDAVWHTSTFRGDKTFTVGGWGARSWGDLPPGQHGGWGASIDYPNDLWDLFANVNEYGEALEPALGFLLRPGTRIYQAGGAYQPRPAPEGALSWIRQFFFELRGRRVDSLEGFTESWRVFTAPFNVETRNGEHFEANWAPQFERLVQPAEIAGVTLPARTYRFDRYRVEAESSSYHSWRVGGFAWFGGFFDGSLLQMIPFASWTSPATHLELSLSRETDTGHVREGRIAERLWQLTVVYAFTPYLVLSTFGQYDADSLGVNTRLRWTIHPGTDLFVVFNRNWRDPIPEVTSPPLSDSLPLSSDQVVVKLRWTFIR